MRRRRSAAAALALLVPGLAAAASPAPRPGPPPRVVDLPLPDGRSARALLLRPADPIGTLVMLPGGTGEVGIAADGTLAHADNVVIRTAPLWLARRYAVLIPDADANLRGKRSGPAYAATVGALTAEARRAVPGLIVLIGTSQGAIAAVNGAAHVGGIAGLVLLEAVSRKGGSGETLFDADPKAVTAPVLVVANAADHCPVTPPQDAPRIAAAFTRSRGVTVAALDGGAPGGRDCGSLSPHGYHGIEDRMVERVSAWLGDLR